VISFLVKLPVFNRLIPSISIKILKSLKKNRGFFRIGDVKMFLDFLDPIDRELILHQEYEKEEISILIELIKKHSAIYFFDIGSNCGYYSIVLAKIFQKLKILAFEPNDEARDKFNKTLSVNSNLSERIFLHKFGLSDITSVLKMRSKVKYGYIQTGGSTVHDNSDLSDVKIYDANFKIADEEIDINNSVIAIKIDVEGHEYNVLKGLKKIINNNKCILQIEIFVDNFDRINQFLIENKFYKISDAKVRLNHFYTNI
tara:strand:- start:101 stop:871 length:771 start_codon:yes stop_codon:yes gene_type:complete